MWLHYIWYTCNKYASLEMYTWSGVLLQLCFGIHSQLFKLAHADNSRFHVIVCCGMVGTTVSKQFLVGTPRKFSMPRPKAISKHQSQLSPPATSHANLQALFPTTPTHQNYQAPFPTSPPHPLFQATIPAQPTRQPRMQTCKLAGTFPNHPRPSKFPSTLSNLSSPNPFSKHQSQPSPTGNLACNLTSTFPNHPRPSKFPSTFFKRRAPSVFQNNELHQMS